MTKFRSTIILFLGSLILSACNFSLAQDIKPPPGYQAPSFDDAPSSIEELFDLQPDPVAGAATFAISCQPCHGSFGLGDGPQSGELPNPPAPIGDPDFAKQSSPQEWFTIISKGNLDNFMPPFENSLSEQQRWDVLAYVYSLNTLEEDLNLGEQIYQTCAECHSANSELASLDFEDRLRMSVLSGMDIQNVLDPNLADENHTFDPPYDDDQIQHVTRYIRSLTFPLLPFDLFEVQEPVSDSDEIAAELVDEVTVMGRVTGRVLNGSSRGIPDDITATLYGYDELNQVLELEVEINDVGEFNLADVPFLTGRSFLVGIESEGVTYASEVISVAEEQTEMELLVTFYEVTSDPSNLVIDQMSLFLQFPAPDLMQVVQLVLISNAGSKTVAPPSLSAPAFEFSLPPGAQNLTFDNGVLGTRYIATQDGFGDSFPILPGDSVYELLFAYELPYSSSLDFVQQVNLKTNSIIVLVPDDSLKISGDGIDSQGVQEFNGASFEMYEVGSLQAGGEVEFRLSGRNPVNPPGFAFLSDTSNLAVGLVVLAVTLLAVGYWRQRGIASDEEAAELDDPEAIMDEIIDLDKEFENDLIKESSYHKLRSELKVQLRDSLDEINS